MKIILTRHGETVENTQGIWQGHLPGKLSKKGIEQAKKLAQQLKEEKIDVIYSSDLARAADTAKEIAKFHKNTQIHFVKEMRERHLGEFQGKKKSDFPWIKAGFVDPKNGETKEQLYGRAERFIHSLLKKHKSQTVLLVGHIGIGLALICVITGKTVDDMGSVKKLENADMRIFEL